MGNCLVSNVILACMILSPWDLNIFHLILTNSSRIWYDCVLLDLILHTGLFFFFSLFFFLFLLGVVRSECWSTTRPITSKSHAMSTAFYSTIILLILSSYFISSLFSFIQTSVNWRDLPRHIMWTRLRSSRFLAAPDDFFIHSTMNIRMKSP